MMRIKRLINQYFYQGEESAESAAEGSSHLWTSDYNMTVQSTVLIAKFDSINAPTMAFQLFSPTDLMRIFDKQTQLTKRSPVPLW